jgi:C-terminal processing protease CtpA/Prc
MWIPLTLHLAALLSIASVQDDEKYAELEIGDVKLFHKVSEISSEEAKSILDNFVRVQEDFEQLFAIEVGSYTVTANLRSGSRRYYSTDGVDKIQLNYPNASEYRPKLVPDPRVDRVAVPTLVQLWLYRNLSTMAGLDPRITESLVQHLDHKIQTSNENVDHHEVELDVWAQIDELYGDGTSAYLWNAVLGQNLPGHEVGPFLRTTASEVTEDPEGCNRILDAICPRHTYFGAMDLAASGPLSAQTVLRQSRVALFNGSRLYDQPATGDDEQFSAGDRLRWFENIFELVVRTYPDRSVNSYPPSLNGQNLWSAYFEYRPRALRAKDNIDYYLVLREFLSLFHDRSISLMTPHATPDFFGVVGISIEASGDRVFVSKVTPDGEPAEAGIRPGLEVTSIDGRPIGDVWNRFADWNWQVGSSSSMQEALARGLNLLFTGAEGSEAVVGLTDPSEAGAVEQTFSFVRGRPTGGNDVKLVESTLREDGIAVIKIRAFAGNVTQLFHSAIEEVIRKKPRGLVIDLRGNEVGTPQNALTAVGRLVDRPITVAMVQGKDNPIGIAAKIAKQPVQVAPLPNVPRYDGKCALLIDAWSAGPAEMFAMAFQNARRGPIVGSQSAGALNQPINPPQQQQQLTAIGVVLQLTHHQVLSADGREVHGLGVVPEAPYELTLEDLANGRDGVLEHAAQMLR